MFYASEQNRYESIWKVEMLLHLPRITVFYVKLSQLRYTAQKHHLAFNSFCLNIEYDGDLKQTLFFEILVFIER